MHTVNDLPAYTYTALNCGEIRLLKPADTCSGHAWNMEIISLDAAELEFDALSYTWGSQNETYPIVCNNHSMRVHHNLFSALPFLAQRTGAAPSRSIWVDAVCINQADEEEKDIQIQLMNTLYRRAKQVWVWLGCGTSEEYVHIPRAIALLPKFVEERNRRKALPSSWQKLEVAPPLHNLDPGIWKAIFYLLRNPWYQRVWIVQEAALAADITFLCGEYEIDREILESAVDSDVVSTWKASDIHGNPVKFKAPLSDSSTVFWIRSLVQRDNPSISLNTPSLMQRVTLLMTGEHACFLPEDRVRGMLGLIDEAELGLTSVKLHSCQSTQELYTEFAAYILLNTDPWFTQFWWPFFNLAFTLERIAGLPSWVPDFHHQAKHTSEVCTRARIVDLEVKTRRYQASMQRATIRQGDGIYEIVISGILLDEITAVYPPIPKKRSDPIDVARSNVEWIMEFARWEENFADAVIQKPDDKSYEGRVSEETYWHTLFANNFFGIATDTTITLDMCRAYRPIMKDARTCCEWYLENLARFVHLMHS
jgi:hypothetical protein